MLISYKSRQTTRKFGNNFFFIAHWTFNGHFIDVDNATNTKIFNRSRNLQHTQKFQ